MLALPNVVADFSAAGAFFAKRVAQSSLPLPSPCKCRAYLPCATCWVCTASVPPLDDVSHFAGSMLPLSKSSQRRPGHGEAPPAPPSSSMNRRRCLPRPDPPCPLSRRRCLPSPPIPWPSSLPAQAAPPPPPPPLLAPAVPALPTDPASPAEPLVPAFAAPRCHRPPASPAVPACPPDPAPPCDAAPPAAPPVPAAPDGVLVDGVCVQSRTTNEAASA